MMMPTVKRLIGCLALFAASLAAAGEVWAVDNVAGSLIVFNDNGAWSWFEDERAIVDPANGRIVVSSVASAAGPGGIQRDGNVEVAAYDVARQAVERFTLSRSLEADDHNSAALVVLPDGRYLASYSKHGSDNQLRYRISTRPGDITSWEMERVFRTGGGTSYSNLNYLSKANTLFNFHRDHGRGFDPNYLVWRSGASGFSYGGRLLTGPERNAGNHDRPYLRYAGNGVDRIDFIATDAHPRDRLANSVYHGYLLREADAQFGVYRSDGTRLGDLSTDTTSPYEAADFTTLLTGNAVSAANGRLMTRGWTTDIELDAAGRPVVLFTARVDDLDTDHRFFFGRYTGSEWSIHELAPAGGFLYDGENDYTGLAAIDPGNPDRVFISTKIDPRTKGALARYEIFEGNTVDGGKNWSWAPITYDSTIDNLRPVVPRGPAGGTALLWMRGSYTSFTRFNTSIVGVTSIGPLAGPATNATSAAD
jgi:hypothetical protein